MRPWPDDDGWRVREVWARLERVTDPELDEPVTALGFIERVAVDSAGGVDIDFRLPTYWCAANFAFLMADDMRCAVGALPWVRAVRPRLRDHMYAEAVNTGVAEGRSFKETFGDLAADEPLDELRETFRKKAFQRRQEAVLLALIGQGLAPEALVDMDVATFDRIVISAPAGAAQKPRYRELLMDLGLAYWPEDRAFVGPDGAPLTLAGFDDYVRDLRSVRINMEFNGALCRGLLKARDRAEAEAGEAGEKGVADAETAEPSLFDFALGRIPPG